MKYTDLADTDAPIIEPIELPHKDILLAVLNQNRRILEINALIVDTLARAPTYHVRHVRDADEE